MYSQNYCNILDTSITWIYIYIYICTWYTYICIHITFIYYSDICTTIRSIVSDLTCTLSDAIDAIWHTIWCLVWRIYSGIVSPNSHVVTFSGAPEKEQLHVFPWSRMSRPDEVWRHLEDLWQISQCLYKPMQHVLFGRWVANMEKRLWQILRTNLKQNKKI